MHMKQASVIVKLSLQCYTEMAAAATVAVVAAEMNLHILLLLQLLVAESGNEYVLTSICNKVASSINK